MPLRSGFLISTALFLAVIPASPVLAQERPGEPFWQFIHGNDKFGIRLLEQVHSENPDKNVVVAPLSLTILLSAIQTSSWREETREELGQVFGWGAYAQLGVPSRMILAAMDQTKARKAPQRAHDEAGDSPMQTESIWIANRLLYRSPKDKPPLLDPRFVASASRDFGLQLVNTGDRNPAESDLRGSRDQLGKVPRISPRDQVWLSSGMHLRQTWEELFMMSEPQPGEFYPESGQIRTMQKLESGLEKLLHVQTDQFEAVALPCGRVQMVIVLPKTGVKIRELEQILAANPDALNGMQASLGSVTFPIFEIRTSMHMEESLKAMGVSDIFQHLDGVTRLERFRRPYDPTQGLIETARSRVTDIGQTIDFAADKHGIHADAETLVGAIPLGILTAPDAFHMSLNRPFLFFVRENTTDALLFAGALMDPSAGSR
jgi:serpin B